MFKLVFKRGRFVSKQKEKLQLVSKSYIHECLNENGMMSIVKNLDILSIFGSVVWINLLVVDLKAN